MPAFYLTAGNKNLLITHNRVFNHPWFIFKRCISDEIGLLGNANNPQEMDNVA